MQQLRVYQSLWAMERRRPDGAEWPLEDGVDVLWVGHFDLSNFMGIPGQFSDPRFDAAMRKVADVCRRHGKAAGFMATDAAWIVRAREMGYTMIAGGTDSGLLQQAFSQLVARIDGAARG